ncbi:MAG TPA: cytochrome C oxidase subunit IV family protein [Chitinophagaceae bacterium]|nr:cytochrome C oxidase subunit IV family protein [Chitinophagaceae bacterium]
MEEQHTASEITFHHDVPGPENVKRIWRTFWLLLVITIIELGMGFSIYLIHKDPNFSHGLVLGIKGAIVILSLAKAFYIVSIFMHLGDEIRNMTMTIIVPLMLFIWFIAAFLYEGNSYKNLRNTYDKHFQERTTIDKKAGGH